MTLPLSSLSLLRPASLRDALHMLRDEGPLVPIAGCTDVYVNLHFGLAKEQRYIDLWPVPELRGIAADGAALRVGALTTYTELIQSALVRRRIPMLAAASREVGGRQIQHRGTIGGNIANASPAGDSLPVLAAADAMIVLQSATAERRVPVTEFFTGYRQTVRHTDELIVAVEIPKIEGRQYWRKVGTRRAQAISKVMCAAVRGPVVKVALGSVAATIVRLPQTERILSSRGTLADAQTVLKREIAPIDDVRSTAEYRREVSANLLADFWRTTAGPAGSASATAATKPRRSGRST
ncbi:MAG TPA: FAD binding domain-containing protein [Vicinamibacterales bacterium]|nr:FAD binding domain-containing protein [Vicinamibacterales bacterium]